ncbi:low temperature requirement protein A [Actinophytocola sp.]|uniref:low temperature requirement protein A n=1 Tax=Actinophytocola sp. TaxID=1872138 RepID=UPI00389A1D38
MAQHETERHASWLELFFDLVAVAAVAEFAHLLHGDAHHGPGGLEITAFFTLYLAIWLVWTTFTMYSNVVADKVGLRAMFFGMAGIATMAAAVPHGMDSRADVFAAAYLLTSAVGRGAFESSGRVLLSWIATSQNFGLVPWIVSFFVDDPWWKIGLWLFGLVLTMVFSVLASRGDQEAMLARMNESLAKRAERTERTRRRGRGGREPQRGTATRARPTTIAAALLDSGHFGERLGLFVIIVLGEAVLQCVGAVAELDNWGRHSGEGWVLRLTIVAAFALLATLWGLNVRYGFAEEPRYPPSVVLPAHFVVVASVTALAAGLGTAVAGSTEHLNATNTWLMCGGLAAFLLVINLLVAHARRWPLRALAVAVPLVAAVLGPWLPAAVVVTAMAVAAGGQLWTLSAVRSDE